MTNSSLFWIAGAIFLVFSPLSLWFLHREYRLYGKLSWFGSIVHVLMYGFHGMFCGLLAWGPDRVPPPGPLGWLGIPLMLIGLGIVLYAMDLFQTFSRWVGSNIPGLSTGKLYRYSRNPQFLGYGLFILGFFIAWWTPLNWLGLLGYAALAYAVTLVEEEHLSRVYGESYREYCQRTPRYLGLPRT